MAGIQFAGEIDVMGEIVRDPKSGLNLDNLTELLGFHVRLAHVAIYRDFRRALEGIDLTQKQAATLQLIGVNLGVSQIDLAITLGTDRSSMMALVDRLQDRGLIERIRSKKDQRRQELYLTDHGKALLVEAKAAILEHEKGLTDRFSTEELDQLFAMLKRLHKRI